MTFLIEEHKNIDDIIAELTNTPLRIFDTDKAILENNIFGVDINDESVEIAKLSLWLRTAQKGRKLSNLNNNIKCGNSLIDDPVVAGDKAFNWEDEFPEIFKNGGFDVVIGNPPYIKEAVNKAAFDGLHDSEYYQGKMDLWTYFGCVGIDLLKDNGLISFISPNNWISNSGASIFRNKMLNSGIILKYIDFNDYKVFKDAGIQTMIYVYTKTNKVTDKYLIDYTKFIDKKINEIDVASVVNGDYCPNQITKYKAVFNPSELLDTNITFSNQDVSLLTKKLENASNYHLSGSSIGNGIDVLQDFLSAKHLEKLPSDNFQPGQGVLVLTANEVNQLYLTEEEKKWLKPYYGTSSINKYIANINNDKYYILYANKEFREKIDAYPNLKTHLDRFSPILTSAFAPYGLHRARTEHFFSQPSIYGLRKTPFTAFSYVDFPCYVTRAFMIIQPDDYNLKALTGLMNSSTCNFWFKNNGKLQGSQLQVDKEPLTRVPLIKPNEKTILILSDLVDDIQNSLLIVNKSNNKFSNYIAISLKVELSNKLQNWVKLESDEFLLELNKVIKKEGGSPLSKMDEMDWMEVFETKKEEVQKLKSEIDKTDKEIDQMVYELYDLTKEEIQIVENS